MARYIRIAGVDGHSGGGEGDGQLVERHVRYQRDGAVDAGQLSHANEGYRPPAHVADFYVSQKSMFTNDFTINCLFSSSSTTSYLRR